MVEVVVVVVVVVMVVSAEIVMCGIELAVGREHPSVLCYYYYCKRRRVE